MIEWWTETQSGWIGGVGGSVVGVFGGGLGALAGKLAPRGRAERLMIGGMASMSGCGVAAMAVGLVALAVGQPWHVWYPFALLGFILMVVATPLTFSLRRNYERAGARRLEAELLRSGAERTERTGRSADAGFIVTAIVAAAILSGGAMAGAIAALQNTAPPGDAAPLHADAGLENVLDNGARFTLSPAPGVGRVAVIAAYDAGFLEDDAGTAQLAHLVEHLRCTNATASFGAGESIASMNDGGAANAETMAHFVYYDFTGPAEGLREMLHIEYERLTSLRVGREDIEREAPRCAAEVDWVARHGGVAIQKFAMMAMVQGWRHGLDHAPVRDAIGEISPELARSFLERNYGPQRLTLHIAGDFSEAEARQILAETIGRVPRAPSLAPPAEIDWSDQPAERRMTWDVPHSCAALAWAAPENSVERIALTFFGAALSEQLAKPAQQGSMPSAIASTLMTPVGALPFHIFITPVGDETIDEAVERTEGALAEALQRGVGRGTMRQLRAMVSQFDADLSGNEVEARARQLTKSAGVSHERAVSMVIGQGALNRQVLRALSGADRAALDEALRLDEEALTEIARRALTPERRFVTVLTPADFAKDQGAR